MTNQSKRHLKGGKLRTRRLKRDLGLQRIEVWVPDTRSPAFAAEAHRQSMAVARSRWVDDDQAFVDLIAE